MILLKQPIEILKYVFFELLVISFSEVLGDKLFETPHFRFHYINVILPFRLVNIAKSIKLFFDEATREFEVEVADLSEHKRTFTIAPGYFMLKQQMSIRRREIEFVFRTVAKFFYCS